MKKKKIIALILGGLILIGGTFIGTNALFTDEKEVPYEILISTGDVDIEVTNKGNWVVDRCGKETEAKDGTSSDVNDKNGNNNSVYDHNGNEQNDVEGKEEKNEKGEKIKDFVNNLKPGDKITKTVTIKNVGTLNANLEVCENKTEGKGEKEKQEEESINGGLFTISSNFKGGTNSAFLEPGKTIELDLIINVNDGGVENLYKESDNIDITNPANWNSDAVEENVFDAGEKWLIKATQQSCEGVS